MDTNNFTIPEVTLATYRALSSLALHHAFSTRDCMPIEGVAAANVLFYLCFTAFLFYVYIMVILWTRKALHQSFRICATSLFIGDMMVLLVSCRGGVVTKCLIYYRPDYTMAFESIGTFCMDLRCSANFALAIVRLSALLKFSHITALSVSGAIFCLTFSTLTFCLSTTGNLSVPWYEGDEYRNRLIEPTQTIRFTALGLFVLASFLIYVGCIVKAYKLNNSIAIDTNDRSKEIAILAQAVVIFIGELLFLYATFLIGGRLGIGSETFNAYLYGCSRPICAALTPVIYILFVREIRTKTFMYSIYLRFFPKPSPITISVSQ